MKKITLLALSAITCFASSAFARDDIEAYSVENALSTAHAKNALGEAVSFYFGDQEYGKVVKSISEVKTNKKTNAFNKSDREACNWVFLSAMIQLKETAVKQGGNAVVDIKSNYRNSLTSSNETFQCGAGTFVAGVALTGRVVKLEK